MLLEYFSVLIAIQPVYVNKKLLRSTSTIFKEEIHDDKQVYSKTRLQQLRS